MNYRKLSTLIIAALLLAGTLYNLWIISDSAYFRHDSLLYLDTYLNKLLTDGRWINYILFDFIKVIPVPILLFTYLLGWFLFSFQCASNYGVDKGTCALFGIACTNIPPLYSLMFWPVSPLTSGLALILLSQLSKQRKTISIYELFFFSGVISFGTFSYIHFLVPLLFIKEITNSSPSKQFKFFFSWVITFVIGYISCNTIVYLASFIALDQPQFLEMAEWRNPNYVSDIYSFIDNISHITAKVIRDLINSPLILLLASSIIILKLNIENKKSIGIWLVLIFFSVYYSHIYHGIEIQYRTICVSFFALLFSYLIIRNKTHRILSLLSVSIIFSAFNFKTVSWYHDYSHKSIEFLEPIRNELSKGGELIFIHLNTDNQDLYLQSDTGRPYGIEPLNNLLHRQLGPYLKEQGFRNLAHKEESSDYKGSISIERKEDQSKVHLYIR